MMKNSVAIRIFVFMGYFVAIESGIIKEN